MRDEHDGRTEVTDENEASVEAGGADDNDIVEAVAVEETDAVGEAAGEDAETQAEAYVCRLESRVAELESKLDKTYAAYRNRERELDRVRERLERDRRKRLFQEKARLFERLLEPMDNLERSMAAAETSGDFESLLKGLGMVHKQVHAVFSAMGLERFDPAGRPFDPEFHEAVSVVPVDDPAGHDLVHTVLQPGYLLGDQVIRPARVFVGKHQGG